MEFCYTSKFLLLEVNLKKGPARGAAPWFTGCRDQTKDRFCEQLEKCPLFSKICCAGGLCVPNLHSLGVKTYT